MKSGSPEIFIQEEALDPGFSCNLRMPVKILWNPLLFSTIFEALQKGVKKLA